MLFGRRIELESAFPVIYGMGDAEVELHADGHIEGDVAAFTKALEDAKGKSPDLTLAVFWLLALELKRQKSTVR